MAPSNARPSERSLGLAPNPDSSHSFQKTELKLKPFGKEEANRRRSYPWDRGESVFLLALADSRVEVAYSRLGCWFTGRLLFSLASRL